MSLRYLDSLFVWLEHAAFAIWQKNGREILQETILGSNLRSSVSVLTNLICRLQGSASAGRRRSAPTSTLKNRPA